MLTNERAYSAQLAMLNGSTDFDQLAGVIHRPEGLHRNDELVIVISSQKFGVSSSITLFFSILKGMLFAFVSNERGEVILKYFPVFC